MILHRQLLNTTYPVILWAYSGSATVDGIELDPGTALLSPGGRHHILLSPDGVVLPVPIRGKVTIKRALIRVTEQLREAFLFSFAHALGYLQRGESARAYYLGILESLDTTGVAAPPMPISPEALKVAQHIVTHLADQSCTADLAARVGLSERTLQRRFRDETGHTLVGWRTKARLHQASIYLSNDDPVQWVAHTVGYSSTGSLSRALRVHHGVTAEELRSPGLQVLSPSAPAPQLPPSHSWPHINASHVLVWACQGDNLARIAGREILLHEGDILPLPAGTQLQIFSPPGSLLLPVGFCDVRAMDLSADNAAPVSAVGADTLLLRAAVESYIPQPARHHRTDRAFQLLPPALRAISTKQSLGILQVDDFLPELRRQNSSRKFSEATGLTPRQWGLLRRMTLARIQLSRGHAPAAVARIQQYSTVASFTRAFRNVHGIGPGQFQQAHLLTGL